MLVENLHWNAAGHFNQLSNENKITFECKSEFIPFSEAKYRSNGYIFQ